ncbi:GntR family transcriptional regulator [Sulfitobacter sp.]|mgnify:CR=1 FL=1|uniref:GntR family transcriptional regulator n=1 Tax=Sulfitobacter sp. TaxID=1903071 RepID=UPI003566D45E
MSSLAAITMGSASTRNGKIRKSSASQQIRDALRERIITLNLTPGENLSRAEIADFYGVSQTPVRDAMMRLEEEGLLHIYPQSKTEVSKIDIDNARETQFLRLALEIEVTRRLISAGGSDLLNAVEQALIRQKQAWEAGDLEKFAANDRAFHRALFEAAKVPDLWDLVTERSGHIDRLRNLNLPDPGKAAEIVAYHQRILDAVKSGDTVTAESEVRGHLTGTLASVETIRAQHPEFF